MYTTKIATKNTVLISGKILCLYHTYKDYLLIRIEAEGDRPSVFVPDKELAKSIENKYEVGDDITILGNIQSSVLTKNDDCQIVNSIYAEKVVENTQSLNLAMFYLEGYIIKIQREKLFTKLIIKTYRNHVSSVPVVFYSSPPENLAVGDRICVSGTIQTKLKYDKDGNKLWYQNYVAR